MLWAQLSGTGRFVLPSFFSDQAMTIARGFSSGVLNSCIFQRRSSSGYVRHGGSPAYQDNSAAVKPIVQREPDYVNLLSKDSWAQQHGLVVEPTVDRGRLSPTEFYQSRSLPIEIELLH